jgi:hypothetical protein
MHPEITRELMRAQQMDRSRQYRRRMAQPRSDAGVGRPRTAARRRRLRSLRSALRQAARLNPGAH